MGKCWGPLERGKERARDRTVEEHTFQKKEKYFFSSNTIIFIWTDEKIQLRKTKVKILFNPVTQVWSLLTFGYTSFQTVFFSMQKYTYLFYKNQIIIFTGHCRCTMICLIIQWIGF